MCDVKGIKKHSRRRMIGFVFCFVIMLQIMALTVFAAATVEYLGITEKQKEGTMDESLRATLSVANHEESAGELTYEVTNRQTCPGGANSNHNTVEARYHEHTNVTGKLVYDATSSSAYIDGLKYGDHIAVKEGGTTIYNFKVLSDKLLNGGFEIHNVNMHTAAGKWNASVRPGSNIYGWYTTATDRNIELQWNLYLTSKTNGIHAELNAYEVASLYQEISAEELDMLDWSLYHSAASNNNDTMAIVVGPALPAGQEYIKTSANGQDLFMNIVAAARQQNGGSLRVGNVYSVTYNNQVYQVTTANGRLGWKYYSGSYKVPAGVTEVVFGFTSLSGAANVGNLLDGISFGRTTRLFDIDFENEVITGIGTKKLGANTTYTVNVDGETEPYLVATDMKTEDDGDIPIKTASYDFFDKGINIGPKPDTTYDSLAIPPRPEAEDLTDPDVTVAVDSITINAKAGQEYSLDGGQTWVRDDDGDGKVVFDGCMHDEGHTIYYRQYATDTSFKSDIKEYYAQPYGHDWPSTWDTVREATATQEGIQSRVCEIPGCGLTQYQTLPRLGESDDITGNGTLEKFVEVTTDSPLRETTINNKKQDLLNGIFNATEQNEVNNSKGNAKVWLEISAAEGLTDADKAKIEAEGEKLSGFDPAGLTYFDAHLFKEVTKADGTVLTPKTQLDQSDIPMEVSVKVPDELLQDDITVVRDYKIIRYFDGKAETIDPVFDEETGMLTFETDKFATFAISYGDTDTGIQIGETAYTAVWTRVTPASESTDRPGVFGFIRGNIVEFDVAITNNTNVPLTMDVTDAFAGSGTFSLLQITSVDGATATALATGVGSKLTIEAYATATIHLSAKVIANVENADTEALGSAGYENTATIVDVIATATLPDGRQVLYTSDGANDTIAWTTNALDDGEVAGNIPTRTSDLNTTMGERAYTVTWNRVTEEPESSETPGKFGFIRGNVVEYDVIVTNNSNVPLTMDVTSEFLDPSAFSDIEVRSVTGADSYSSVATGIGQTITVAPGATATVRFAAQVAINEDNNDHTGAGGYENIASVKNVVAEVTLEDGEVVYYTSDGRDGTLKWEPNADGSSPLGDFEASDTINTRIIDTKVRFQFDVNWADTVPTYRPNTVDVALKRADTGEVIEIKTLTAEDRVSSDIWSTVFSAVPAYEDIVPVEETPVEEVPAEESGDTPIMAGTSEEVVAEEVVAEESVADESAAEESVADELATPSEASASEAIEDDGTLSDDTVADDTVSDDTVVYEVAESRYVMAKAGLINTNDYGTPIVYIAEVLTAMPEGYTQSAVTSVGETFMVTESREWTPRSISSSGVASGSGGGSGSGSGSGRTPSLPTGSTWGTGGAGRNWESLRDSDGGWAGVTPIGADTTEFAMGVAGSWFVIDDAGIETSVEGDRGDRYSSLSGLTGVSGSDIRFLLSDGSYMRNRWALISTTEDGVTRYEWYHFGSDGSMDTGWFLDITNLWYYLSEEIDTLGTMNVGWHLDPHDGRDYYLDLNTGVMYTGWNMVDSSWYYFTAGTPIETWEYNELTRKWVYKNIEGDRPLGSMYVDESTPDGYTVSTSGEYRA